MYRKNVLQEFQATQVLQWFSDSQELSSQPYLIGNPPYYSDLNRWSNHQNALMLKQFDCKPLKFSDKRYQSLNSSPLSMQQNRKISHSVETQHISQQGTQQLKSIQEEIALELLKQLKQEKRVRLAKKKKKVSEVNQFLIKKAEKKKQLQKSHELERRLQQLQVAYSQQEMSAVEGRKLKIRERYCFRIN